MLWNHSCGIVALFLVIEAVTVGLTTIWFAGGALVAAVASGLGASQAVQWILFFAVSVILLIFTRPLAVRYMNRGVERTNVNRTGEGGRCGMDGKNRI